MRTLLSAETAGPQVRALDGNRQVASSRYRRKPPSRKFALFPVPCSLL
ncbi:MAG: hypothetical protein VKK42_14985 [Lyngbya sp.]|nr:hypothetical protein [Lyngbya sp.]